MDILDNILNFVSVKPNKQYKIMANENVNKSVVGFSVDKYDMDYLNGLSPKYLYELAWKDEDAVIYDSVDTFFKELNYDLVDTENYLWFLV